LESWRLIFLTASGSLEASLSEVFAMGCRCTILTVF
jgi:hypothetical protein